MWICILLLVYIIYVFMATYDNGKINNKIIVKAVGVDTGIRIWGKFSLFVYEREQHIHTYVYIMKM